MRLFLFGFAMSLSALLQAQCGGRYVWEIFSSVNSIPDIQYGANDDYEGNSQDLFVDFYEPTGDTLAERPLVILAHGGFFISGDRTAADIVGFCEGLARRGYACASLQYRLGVGLSEVDSAGFSKAVVRGVQDAKAAVRFFRANGESYGIDTAQIFLGGTSAGGVLAVHYAYLQNTDLSPDWINTLIDELGGLEGNSGNPGYSTRINGVVSYAGAFKDINWMGPRAVPVASTHGTEDAVVPYGFGMVTYVVIPVVLEIPITTMYGSSALHEELDDRGIDNEFWSFEGAGHVPHLQPPSFGLDPVIFPQTLQWTAEFLHKHLECYDPLAGLVQTPEIQSLEAWPVPSADEVRVSGLPDGDHAEFVWTDLSGRVLRRVSQPTAAHISLSRAQLPAGMYILEVRTQGGEHFRARLAYH